MNKTMNKKILILMSLLLFLPLFVGCFGTPVNHAPTITSTPITTATVDILYTCDVEATDPDGDTLTYSLTTNPSGMTINSTIGVISWTPNSDQIGDHSVTVEVSDGSLSDTQSFIIKVGTTPVSPTENEPPAITSAPITTATVAILYTYNVNATDPNGDTLTYSLTTNPSGMTINSSTGVINWTPTSGQIGDNNVTVKVSDGELFDTQSFIITVSSTPTSNLKLSPCPQSVTLGNQATIDIVVEDVTDLRGASITLNFESSKLQYSYSSKGSFIPNATLLDSSTSNSVTLDIAGLGASSYHSGMGTGTIITVKFDTVALASPTIITFGSTTLRDKDNNTISHTKGSSCSVTINQNGADKPTVVTNDASNIGDTSATANGNITDTGGENCTVRGFQYGLSQTPTWDEHSSGSFGTGSYSEGLSGLDCETTYYVRAYATNCAGTDYGDWKSFTTADCLSPPTVITNAVSSIEATTATVNGCITDTGGENCLICGFRYGLNQTPTWEVLIFIGCPIGTGCWSEELSGLTPNTIYFVQAYAANSAGAGYGNWVSFITGPITPNLKLNPSSQTVTLGNQATISVVVEDVTDLRGASITLNFESSKLQYSSSSKGSFIPNATLMDSSTSSSVTLDIAGLGASGYHSGMGTGTIITVVFDTIATASPTNITFGSTTLRDKDNITITHTKSSGCSVTIN